MPVERKTEVSDAWASFDWDWLEKDGSCRKAKTLYVMENEDAFNISIEECNYKNEHLSGCKHITISREQAIALSKWLMSSLLNE